MNFKISQQLFKKNIRDALRSAGYFGIIDRRSGQTSFVRRLSLNQYYPRFHLYLEANQDYLNFSLHLDQKKVSYIGQRAHSGESGGPEVKQEAARIQSLFK